MKHLALLLWQGWVLTINITDWRLASSVKWVVYCRYQDHQDKMSCTLKLNTHNFKIFEEFLNISFVHMSESKRSTRFYSATLRFMMCPKYNVYFKGPAVFKGIIFWTLHYVLPTKPRGCRPWGLIVLVNPHSVHGHALSSGGNIKQFTIQKYHIVRPGKITNSAQYYIWVQSSNLLTDQFAQSSFLEIMIIPHRTPVSYTLAPQRFSGKNYKCRFKASQIILVGSKVIQ